MDTEKLISLPERCPTLRMLAMPTDTNVAGDIFGGWIMSQVDIAGSVVAYRQAQGRVVTVAVNSFVFHKPVFVGDLVNLYADVTRIGNTSITVDVVVYAERHRSQKQVIRVTEATLTYVAVDQNRQPRKLSENKKG
ncbi:MAG: acyl-CoA thioesterase [Gammaproteobacteria bacterium]|nr:acyl-CoA thioesterase [Gammaproteobacteria bacterium]